MSVWSGLGMGMFSTVDTSQFDEYCDTLKSYGILDIRVDIPDYQDTTWLARSKAAVIRAVAKGMRVVWGVSSNSKNNVAYTITSSSWSDFHAAILDAAAWAQVNGVWEFQLGNEEETHNDDDTLTDAQLRTNIKSTATEVQAIFTNGNVSYSFDMSQYTAWPALGRGDIDIMCCNIYRGAAAGSFNNGWILYITTLLTAFGADNFKITEFNLSSTSLSSYSANSEVQARELGMMVEKFKDLGVTKAYFFCYANSNFGVISSYGSDARAFWNNLVTDNGRKFFII